MNEKRQLWDISVGYETPIKTSHENKDIHESTYKTQHNSANKSI